MAHEILLKLFFFSETYGREIALVLLSIWVLALLCWIKEKYSIVFRDGGTRHSRQRGRDIPRCAGHVEEI